MLREIRSGGSSLRFTQSNVYGLRIEPFDRARFPLTLVMNNDVTQQLKLVEPTTLYWDTPQQVQVVHRDAEARFLVTHTEVPGEAITDAAEQKPVRIAKYVVAPGGQLATGQRVTVRTGATNAEPTSEAIFTHRWRQQVVLVACSSITGTAPNVDLEFHYCMGAEESGGELDEGEVWTAVRTRIMDIANAPLAGEELTMIHVGTTATFGESTDLLSTAWSPYSSVTLNVQGGGATVTFPDGLRVEWWGLP